MRETINVRLTSQLSRLVLTQSKGGLAGKIGWAAAELHQYLKQGVF